MFLFFAGINLINNVQQTSNDWNAFLKFNQGIDEATRWISRFNELNKDIPFDADRVGYISEGPQGTEYILTQYAIIPHVLVQNANTEWIIAIFPGKNIYKKMSALGIDYDSIREYSFGINLIHTK